MSSAPVICVRKVLDMLHAAVHVSDDEQEVSEDEHVDAYDGG